MTKSTKNVKFIWTFLKNEIFDSPHVSSNLIPNRFHAHNVAHHNEAAHGHYQNHSSSFRQSYHSSTSSLGSADRAGEDTICALNIPEMVANGIAVNFHSVRIRVTIGDHPGP